MVKRKINVTLHGMIIITSTEFVDNKISPKNSAPYKFNILQR